MNRRPRVVLLFAGATVLTGGLLIVAPAVAQAPPVRIDFEGVLSKAAAPAPSPARVPGAPVRVDFEASRSRTDTASPRDAASSPSSRAAPGPPLRVDFEGARSRSESTVTPPPTTPPSQPQGQPGQQQRQPPQKEAEKATITGVQPPCLRPGTRVTILGRGFGQASGNRRVVLTGKEPLALTVSSWSDSSIVALVPMNARLDPQLKYIVGIQDETSRLTTNPFTTSACR